MKINVNYYTLNPKRFIAGTEKSYGFETMELVFSREWDTLAKKVVFYPDGEDPVSVVYTGEAFPIPVEVMRHRGTSRYSVFGYEDNRVLITTSGEIDVLRTLEDTNDPSDEPTPSEKAQIIECMNTALETAQSVRNDADNGVFDGADGIDGTNGVDGITPHIGENGNWFFGDTDTGIKARGEDGEKGDKGDKGDTGETGPKGDKGDTGETGPKGDKGDKGDTGESGDPSILINDEIDSGEKTWSSNHIKAYISENAEDRLLKEFIGVDEMTAEDISLKHPDIGIKYYGVCSAYGTPTPTNPVEISDGNMPFLYAQNENYEELFYISPAGLLMRGAGRCRDSVVLERASRKVTHTTAVEKIVFDGTQSFTAVTRGTARYFEYTFLTGKTPDPEYFADTLCSHFVYSDTTKNNSFYFTDDKKLRIRYDTCSSVAAFLSWLTSNNVTMVYGLEHPVTDDITGTEYGAEFQKAIYDGCQTFRMYSNAPTDFVYARDLGKIIDSINQRIESLGSAVSQLFGMMG